MSASKAWYIHCDICGEDSGFGQCAETAAEARLKTRWDGWHARPGARDICPNCWAEGSR